MTGATGPNLTSSPRSRCAQVEHPQRLPSVACDKPEPGSHQALCTSPVIRYVAWWRACPPLHVCPHAGASCHVWAAGSMLSQLVSGSPLALSASAAVHACTCKPRSGRPLFACACMKEGRAPLRSGVCRHRTHPTTATPNTPWSTRPSQPMHHGHCLRTPPQQHPLEPRIAFAMLYQKLPCFGHSLLYAVDTGCPLVDVI